MSLRLIEKIGKVANVMLAKKLDLGHLNDKQSCDNFIQDAAQAKAMEKQPWFEDYNYHVDECGKRLIITRYFNKENTEKVIVPRYARLHNKKYKVVLSCDEKKGIFEGSNISEAVIFATVGSNLTRLFAKCKNLRYVNLVHFDARHKMHPNTPAIIAFFEACFVLLGYPKSIINTTALFYALVQAYWVGNHSDNDARIDTTHMFKGCSKLNKVEVGYYHYPLYFETRNIKHLSSMFAGCKSLNKQDVNLFEY